jgi:hypothetical protein
MADYIDSFVIKAKNNLYIGVDHSSGGYPYETDIITLAKIWTSKKDAYEYSQKFKDQNWTLHSVIINTVPTRWF